MAVTHRATQDATQHVAATFVRRRRAIGERHREAANVIGDDAVGDIDVIIELSAVWPRAGTRANRFENGRPQVGVVVRALVLNHRDKAFETHAGIDVLRRQRLQRTIGLAVELDENVIPDLKDIGVAGIDHLRRIAAAADAVVVNLRARSARPGLTHLPEVVLHVAGDDMILRKQRLPQGLCLKIGLKSRCWIPLKPCRIEAIGVEAIDLREQFKAPPNRLLLEVVAEGPVAEHLEEGVVVGVLAHVFEVVVLAAGANALLCVDRARVVALTASKEDVLELVHAGVCEEKRWVVVGDDGA